MTVSHRAADSRRTLTSSERHAKEKKKLLNNNKFLIIESEHPSPLSAYRGFFGSKPFSKTNDYLISNNIEPIKWNK